jgi:hypothetical protein
MVKHPAASILAIHTLQGQSTGVSNVDGRYNMLNMYWPL